MSKQMDRLKTQIKKQNDAELQRIEEIANLTKIIKNMEVQAAQRELKERMGLKRNKSQKSQKTNRSEGNERSKSGKSYTSVVKSGSAESLERVSHSNVGNMSQLYSKDGSIRETNSQAGSNSIRHQSLNLENQKLDKNASKSTFTTSFPSKYLLK